MRRWILPAGLAFAAATLHVPEAVGRNAALKTAGSILARADLEATWIVCSPPRDGRSQPGCDLSPASHELVVRLTHSSPAGEDGNSRAFGYSLIDATTEIGHQLLGSNDHSARVLMRETWTADELTRNRVDDWRFSTEQRAALHARWASWGFGRRAGTRAALGS